MPTYRMELGAILYNDAGNGTVTIRLHPAVTASVPNVPAGIDPSNFYPQGGQPIDIVVPAQKLPDVVMWALAVKADPTAPGGQAWYRYTKSGENWVNPVRCNPDGTVPYTGG